MTTKQRFFLFFYVAFISMSGFYLGLVFSDAFMFTSIFEIGGMVFACVLILFLITTPIFPRIFK